MSEPQPSPEPTPAAPDAPSPSPAEAPSSLLERLATPERLLGGAALLYGFFWIYAWSHFGGRAPLHANDSDTLALFGRHEGPFFITALLFQLLVVGWLGLRLRRRWPAAFDELWRDLEARPRRAYVAFAVMAAGLALLVGFGVLSSHVITEDEETYLFQMHLLRHGHLSIPVPLGAGAFRKPFVVALSGPRWTGEYPWAQPAALLVGALLGSPWIIPPIEAALTVYFTARLAEEYTDDARAGVVAAMLAATSPLLVLTGGTLHNASLAAACTAASLWAVVRACKRPGPAAWITLGVATGVGLHARMLDQAAMMLGAGLVVLARFRGDLRGLVRAIGPAVLVSLPFFALFAIVNHVAYGRWSATGHALFNDAYGWITMGFGKGPFDTPHTPALAMAKTITVLVRVAFYVTGSPLGFALLALPILGVRPRGLSSLAPLVPVLVVAIAYFFYAASSIDPTGPVYYLPLVPLLVAWMAMVAIDLDAAAISLPRAVPTFLCAQAAAALIVFWPAQIRSLMRDVEQATECEALLEDAGIKRGLTFAITAPARRELYTWRRLPPLSEPPFDAPILWARPLSADDDAFTAKHFAGDRPVYLATCGGLKPSISYYDPQHRKVRTLDGRQERALSPDEERILWPPMVGAAAPKND